MSPKPKRSPARFIPLVLIAGGAAWYALHRYQLAHAPYEWHGTVEARTMQVGSRAGGRVADVKVHEGDHVGSNGELVVLERGDWDAQLAQAQGSLDQAEANLAKLKAGSRPEEIAAAKARTQTATAALEQTRAGSRPEEIAAAKARLDAQDVAVAKAKKDAERQHQLDASGAAIKAEVDNADIALRSAIAQRDALAAQLLELQNGARREEKAQAAARAAEQNASEKLVIAGSRVEDIRAAEAQVLGAKGKLEQVKTMIDELTIRSPRAARVEALQLRPGDILAPNATATTLLEDGQLFVRIYVPETQIGHIRVGQKVPIRVDSFPDATFDGIVEHINSVGEYSPRNLQTADERADQMFATRVGIVSGADKLRAGMAAFIEVPRE
jgi:HlyD family secretion protein